MIRITSKKSYNNLPEVFSKSKVISINSFEPFVVNFVPENSVIETRGNTKLIVNTNFNEIIALDNSIVVSEWDGIITATDNSTVISHCRTIVSAYSKSNIVAFDNSFVSVFDDTVTIHQLKDYSICVVKCKKMPIIKHIDHTATLTRKRNQIDRLFYTEENKARGYLYDRVKIPIGSKIDKTKVLWYNPEFGYYKRGHLYECEFPIKNIVINSGEEKFFEVKGFTIIREFTYYDLFDILDFKGRYDFTNKSGRINAI